MAASGWVCYRYNLDLFLFWNGTLPEPVREIFLGLTLFGDGNIVILFLLLYILRHSGWWKISLPLGVIGLFSYAASGILVQVIKHCYPMLRPLALLGLHQVNVLGSPLYNHSFPSGHAASAMALAALGMLMAKTRPARALWLLLGVLVALSRVVIGAHWPFDVLVGGVLGFSTTHILYQFRNRLEDFFARLQRKRTAALSWLHLFFAVLAILVGINLLFWDRYFPASWRYPFAPVAILVLLFFLLRFVQIGQEIRSLAFLRSFLIKNIRNKTIS